MSGKLVALILLVCMLVAGASIYYLQVYGFYTTVQTVPETISVPDAAGGQITLPVRDFSAIDATSSPLRYRACFATDPALLADATPFTGATPLIGPRWFDCFDAGRLTADLQSGQATAYILQADFRPGVDRVMAVYPDGRAFEWHQLTESAEEKRTID